jgi:hypothetical protein
LRCPSNPKFAPEDAANQAKFGFGQQRMSTLLNNLVPIAIGAVAVVLVLGLFNMMRGGSPNTSQRLMRLRVLLQFIAIIVIMAAVWAMKR